MFLKEKNRLVKLPTDKILPNPSQPRKTFTENELLGLSVSISENGLLQPIVVRRDNNEYILIAGERRLRACKIAGMKEIPAIITYCKASDSAVWALLENLQRKDLQFFEQANAIVNLLREWEITQEEAARRLGISPSYLANKLRLLKLSSEEQSEVIENHLTERHARALVRINDITLRRKILKGIIEKGLNVTQTEAMIELFLKPKPSGKKAKRTFIAKDIRLFINTIDHAVDVMKTAGIQAEAKRKETDEYIECTVRIPKLKRVQV